MSKNVSVIAVRLHPSPGRVRETDYHAAETYEWDGDTLVILNGDDLVAQYGRDAVINVRHSTKQFSGPKVRFVRRFVRQGGEN